MGSERETHWRKLSVDRIACEEMKEARRSKDDVKDVQKENRNPFSIELVIHVKPLQTEREKSK